MSEYIYFTNEQKRRANAVDLVDFLERQGEKLIKSGPEKRLASDHSITVRGSEWFDHAEGARKGGLAIDFVQYHYGLSFPEAVTMLLNGEQGQGYRESEHRKPEPKKAFALPPANDTMRRVFAYLIKSRLLDQKVVSHFAHAGLLYEDAQYHNAVFVGRDKEGVARHAHKRGTYCARRRVQAGNRREAAALGESYTGGDAYKGNVEGCDPHFSFHYAGTSDTVYVFEAPIDMLSFISLYQQDWQRHSYVALCGVAEHALLQLLADHPQISKIGLCLDHDEAGIKADKRIAGILAERGYQNVFPLFSVHKDWNEDIKAAHGLEAIPAEEPSSVPQQVVQAMA